MAIALTEEMTEKLDNALENKTPCLYAVVGPDGYPSMSYRGSLIVLDREHLAYWDRALRGANSVSSGNGLGR